ncbi:hypothetical protein QJS83_08640 [Bdellovibrio sp. 22V]|uniref:hypothetical protein n=1 Tax=Bdellovibrio TaxID=958 RepID=UPI002543E2A9|nr:hypothetical protein [Bdellovibrio sp. 22V]WII73942.1 hypothetical protein QJS83_08640 [Bdellovibrio sp. 22V]
MKRILLGLLFGISLQAVADPRAVDSSRVEYLQKISSLYQYDGPNCFASVAYASGFLDEASYLDSSVYEAVLKAPECAQLSSENELREGDFILIGGMETQDQAKWGHAILYLGAGQVFAKMGFRKEEPTSIVSLHENIRWYITQDTFVQGKRAAYPSYFRCDWQGIKTRVASSSLAAAWKELQDIRKKIFAETYMQKSDDHESESARLEKLEEVVKGSTEPAFIKNLLLALINNTRDQIHLLDAIIVGS